MKARGWTFTCHKAHIFCLKRFKSKANGSVFTVFNAHLDHLGIESRKNGADVILERARPIEHVVFLMGDLNSPETDPGYQTLTGQAERSSSNSTWHHIEALTSTMIPGKPTRLGEGHMALPTHRVLRRGQILQNLQRQKEMDQHFADLRYVLQTRSEQGQLSGPYGDQDTFTAFGKEDPASENAPARLDYIMVLRHNTEIHVRRFGVLSNLFDDGMYISDHRPVVAVVDW